MILLDRPSPSAERAGSSAVGSWTMDALKTIGADRYRQAARRREALYPDPGARHAERPGRSPIAAGLSRTA